MPEADPPDDDASIIRRVLGGEREAYVRLAERYSGTLAALAYDRLDTVTEAQDAVQEALVIAYERLATLREPGRFGPWIYEILRNICGLRIRRRQVERNHGRRIKDDRPVALTVTPLDNAMADERLVRLRAAVKNLTPSLREAIMVRYLGDAGRREAAAILDIGQDAFDKRIERALRELREMMSGL